MFSMDIKVTEHSCADTDIQVFNVLNHLHWNLDIMECEIKGCI